MFLLFSIITLIAFVVFFYLLWSWFFSLLPLLFLLWFFLYLFKKTPITLTKISLSQYNLYIAWFVILLSVFGILSFFSIPWYFSFLWILLGNFVLWIFSYGINFSDGKKIFQFWYYLTLFLFFIIGLFVFPYSLWISFALLLLALHFWIIWFINFIVKIRFFVEEEYLYNLFVSGLLLIFAFIIYIIPSLNISLSLISVLLLLIYVVLWWFVQKKPVFRDHVSVRRILAWEKITQKVFFSTTFLTYMYKFVVNMPKQFRFILEILNILVVVLLFFSFILNFSHISWFSHFFYWIVISIFVGNVLLLKKIGYSDVLQNLFLFFVIHFAVYISLFSYFEASIQSVVLWSVLWNIFTSVLLFILPRYYGKFFVYKDCRYWIVTSIMSFLANVFLLFMSWLDGELLFFLLLLYLGIESMLIFYGIKYIGTLFIKEE